MTDMYDTSLKLQKSLVEATAAMTKMMSENYLRFLQQQSTLFNLDKNYHRTEDKPVTSPVNPKARKQKAGKKTGRKVVSPCCGADLHDHYGKRARDVDVDRI